MNGRAGEEEWGFWLQETIKCFCRLLELKPGVLVERRSRCHAADQITPSAHASETSERKRDRGQGQERQNQDEECV